ncbi:NUDIX domain-containing protein, partial [Candidatus Dojkabacteria bacterium]|nr:NUDIX domain-containing protein [Candidatus Dojkabacteria bacterium]
ADKGKEQVGRIDDVKLKEEKQPKVSVGVLVRRFVNGQEEFLLGKRLKQPYYGRVGGFTGKVRFGETLEETGRRELVEECGLDGDFQLAGIVRKISYTGEYIRENLVQDQVMALFLVENVRGDLIEETKESRNFWHPYEKIKDRDDLFNTFLRFLEISRTGKMDSIEYIGEAEGY